ncbi:MAG: hypothetical protein HYZ75_10825 [Elusimicrobia bacterium]|nr:hypothetical protein [Elusimicrobiota bacterium]
MKSFASAALLCAAAASAASEAPRWPPPPDPPRLVYERAVSGTLAREAKGGWGRLLNVLLGVLPGDSARGGEGGLVLPTGIAARGGVIWVADPGAKGVFRYHEATAKGDWLPKGGEKVLESPVAVAAAPDGRLFVADSALGKVFILDAAGRMAGELRGDPMGLGRPVGLAVGGGRLYVSDTLNHRVSFYSLDGVFLAAAGRRGGKPGDFNFPTYLWYDAAKGRLWVCDSGNFRLQALDREGRPVLAVGEAGNRPGYLARPRGVAVDPDGHPWVVDGAFDSVSAFDEQGRLLLFVGVSGYGPGEFNLPGGAAFDEAGRLLVADTRNSRLQIFRYLKEAAR